MYLHRVKSIKNITDKQKQDEKGTFLAFLFDLVLRGKLFTECVVSLTTEELKSQKVSCTSIEYDGNTSFFE